MEKSLGSGRKKVVSGHRNQTLFSFRLIIDFIKVPQPFSSLVNFKVYWFSCNFIIIKIFISDLLYFP